MTTKFLRRVNDFSLVDDKALNVHDVLPPGNYVIKQTPEGVMYLHKVEDFTHPKKMYGHTMERAERIMSTFLSRPRGTGVLFSGEKGSGKTLLARTVCIEAAIQGIPTIIINAAWSGDNFMTFLSSITQPCIVLFDEFEKVYDTKKNEQDTILTLLDGVFPSKKLFLLTCNDRFGINTNMINRPGRIFYSLEFRGLDADFIREYSEDNLDDKSHVDRIVRVTSIFSEFNFDMLQALIEEMNRYKEAPAAALEMLNVSPVYDYATYKVSILMGDGAEVIPQHTYPSEIRQPLTQKTGIDIRVYTKIKMPAGTKKKRKADYLDDDEDMKELHLKFFPTDVISATEDGLVLRNANGDVMNLTKQKLGEYKFSETAAAL